MNQTRLFILLVAVFLADVIIIVAINHTNALRVRAQTPPFLVLPSGPVLGAYVVQVVALWCLHRGVRARADGFGRTIPIAVVATVVLCLGIAKAGYVAYGTTLPAAVARCAATKAAMDGLEVAILGYAAQQGGPPPNMEAITAYSERPWRDAWGFDMTYSVRDDGLVSIASRGWPEWLAAEIGAAQRGCIVREFRVPVRGEGTTSRSSERDSSAGRP